MPNYALYGCCNKNLRRLVFRVLGSCKRGSVALLQNTVSIDCWHMNIIATTIMNNPVINYQEEKCVVIGIILMLQYLLE